MIDICVVTGSRADFGLLVPLLRSIQHDSACNLSLVACGSHGTETSASVGEIADEGFPVNEMITTFVPGDDRTAMARSIGKGVLEFTEYFSNHRPDVVVILGDRFEIFSAAIASSVADIYLAHIHGGEVTVGSLDDTFRHCISKLAHLHFVAHPVYRQRLIRMGEQPERVHTVGCINRSQILALLDMSRQEVYEYLRLPQQRLFLLVTYHPDTTLSDRENIQHFRALLEALDFFDDVEKVITASNNDACGLKLNEIARQYCLGTHSYRYFDSLGRRNYLNCAANALAVVGNSSSGLIEVPSLGVPTVNIGYRQVGRESAESVLWCKASTHSIVDAIRTVTSAEFKAKLELIANPYETELDVHVEMLRILKTTLSKGVVTQKIFEDIK